MAERRIDRETIVAAARRLLEQDGAGRFSIRKLAAALDSKPMTLYHYVSGKFELFDLVLADTAADVDWPDPTGAPRDRMIAVGVGMHQRLTAIPWVVPILQTGTRIGPPAVVLADRFLAAAIEAGLTDRRALWLWRGVWYLVSADLVLQASLAPDDPQQRPWFETDVVDRLPEAPTVRALLPEWSAAAASYRVETSIAALVDGTLHADGAPGSASPRR